MRERIHTTCSEASFALCRYARRVLGCPLRGDDQFVAGTEDMKAACRHIPVAEAHQRFSIVVVWSVADSRWVFA